MKFSLKEFVEAMTDIDKNLGFSKFVKYISIFCLILALFNYKTVLKDAIEIFSEISDKIHSEKMELRDQLLAELRPLLTEFRSNTRADRLLYFEYHNSKENLISIPFKYVELVQQDNGFAIPSVDPEQYKSINTGLITNIYEDIKFGSLVYCSGPNDSVFMEKYSGIYELINSRDGSKRQVFISIPGINQPIGLIILEWMNESNIEINIDEITKTATHNYIPRINAVILSKSPDKNKWL